MTPHFSNSELTCKCGCGMLPDYEFMLKVEKLREACGFSLPVSSAARCPDYNTAVSKTGFGGPHTTGHAIDLAVSRDIAAKVLETAIKLGLFTGIGINQKGTGRFIHLDDLPCTANCPRPTIWSY